MKIGLLTGGGDAPGLNGIIEAAGRTLIGLGHELVGIQNGFEGVFNQKSISLTLDRLMGLHTQAGTTLGTSNRSGIEGREKEFILKWNSFSLDGMIVAGGDGTFRGLKTLGPAIRCLGVPKTIDNDLSGTEVTFGFDTACSVVAESVESLWHTAQAHRRVFVVETMGRTAGWIALGGGLASYSDAILLPERPFSREALLEFLRNRKKAGHTAAVIVVAEGAHPVGEDASVAFRVKDSPQQDRFGGIAERLARWIESELNWEARHVVLGHLQRSRAPTTTDRFLTLGMGVKVAQLAHEKKWGKAVVFKNGAVQEAAIEELMGPPRLVDPEHRWVQFAHSLNIFI